jgi:ribonuclease HI
VLASHALTGEVSRSGVHALNIVLFAGTPLLVAEFDSSLSGSGVIWYARDSGTEVVLGVSAVCLGFLGFGVDSSNQNLAEYIGAIIAMAGQVMLGYSGRSLALRGDSVAALTWAISERPRGEIVTNASIVWTLLCVATNIDVREITHIPGDENERCDRLSRRGAAPVMSVREDAREMGIDGGVVLEVNGDVKIMGLLRLCDPRGKLESDADFIAFWTDVRDVVNIFVDHHAPHIPATSGIP